MARVLHLLTDGRAALALATIARQAADGEEVTVGLLPGAARPPLPPGVTVRRVGEDLSYPELVDLVFAADQVIAW